MRETSVRLTFPRRVFVFAGVVGLLSAIDATHAQSGQYAIQDFAAGTVQLRDPARVTAKYVGTPLATTLDDIAKRAGVRVSYNESVATSSARVTTDLENLSVANALASVLRGTGLVAVQISPTQWGIKQTSSVAQGILTGRVVHARTKQPMAGVTITVGDGKQTVTTGNDGRFRISLDAGEHRIHVRAMGFVRQTRQTTVTSGETTEMEISLEPSASVLDEVVVTGTVVETERKAIPTPITIVTAEDIEKRNITRIEDLFRGQVPGVVALEIGTMRYGTGTGQTPGALAASQVYSRGASTLDGKANPMKTYVDGVELLDPNYLGTIDPKSIERIEIITGPQAATIYGAGAMGGVMQIFTKKGAGAGQSDVTLNIKYGALENNFTDTYTPFHDDAISLAGGNGSLLTYAVNLSHRYSGAWQPYVFTRTLGGSVGATYVRDRVTTNGSVSLTSGSNGTASRGSTRCYMNDAWNRACNTTFYEYGARQDGSLAVSNLGGAFGGMVSRSMAKILSFGIDFRHTQNFVHHLTVGRSETDFSVDPERPSFNTPTDTLLTTKMSAGHRTSMNYNTTYRTAWKATTHSLAAGATGSMNQSYSINGSLASLASSSFTNPRAGRSVDKESWGVFGSWQVGLLDRIFLSLGLRGERNPNYGDSGEMNWTPVNGLTFTQDVGNVTVKLLGSYGRTTRTPTPDMRLPLMSTLGNLEPYLYRAEAPYLTPEYSQGPQGGVELYLGNQASLTVTHYQQTVTNLIQSVIVDSVYEAYSPTSGYWWKTFQYQNVAKVRQRGWEGTGSVTLGAFAVRGTWSWNDTRVLDVNPWASVSYYAGQSLGFAPTHSGSMVLEYARGGTRVTWITNAVGSVSRDISYRREFLTRIESRMPMYELRQQVIRGEVSTGGYAKSDVTASHRLTPWASATLNIQNVGNSYQSDLGAIWPTLGRTTLIGVSLRRAGK